MKQKFEKNTLRLLLGFGLIMFIKLIMKPPTKDWMLIFFFKGFISSILDKLAVTKGKIVYPVNLFKWFDISFIFDYLLFPIACVYYNQVTKTSNMVGIIVKCLFFSVPMTLIEYFFETKTSLVKFKDGWNIYVSFVTLTVTFVVTRFFIMFVRSTDDSEIPRNSDL